VLQFCSTTSCGTPLYLPSSPPLPLNPTPNPPLPLPPPPGLQITDAGMAVLCGGGGPSAPQHWTLGRGTLALLRGAPPKQFLQQLQVRLFV
jgi:hypothetical protein